MLPYTSGHARIEVVDALLTRSDEFLEEVHRQLLQAQQYTRRFYDAHHRALEYAVVDWVLLRLLHHHMQSLVSGEGSKLGPKYASPFQVLEHIGEVAWPSATAR
jgi:hypothetical protein